MDTSSRALYNQVDRCLVSAIPQERERQTVTRLLLEHYCKLEVLHAVLDESIPFSPTQKKLLSAAIERLKRQEPIQYVLGKAHFLGRDFQVSPAVLIPRPETEAFVQYIIEKTPRVSTRVLDIGTGSGCIAITLQKELHQATVHALDVAPEALRIAQTNAQQLAAAVHFMQVDLLREPLPDQRWDIMVSNPPYVRIAEQKQMHPRVLDYEPAQALFVPDEKPLIFYEKMVALAPQHLTPKGKLYLEVNEALGAEVASLLVHTGFEAVYIRQDLNGKDRWVVGTWEASLARDTKSVHSAVT